MWEELHGKMMMISDEVPDSTTYSNSSKSLNMPWCNSSFKRHRKAKDKCWAEFNDNPTSENLNIALEKQQTFEKVSNNAKIRYEQKICRSLKYNPKPLYSYLRSRDIKTCVSNLDNGQGGKTSSATETANVLADAFSSVFVEEPLGPLPDFSVNANNDTCISDINIQYSEVLKELKSLDISKSAGPDNIHAKLLKSLSLDSRFVSAVTMLLCKCASSGSIPDIWKDANVIALFKKGSKSDPLNYRPVSLTCIMCKIYEKLIKRHILGFIDSSIIKEQHGFVNNKSCFSNILETVDIIFNILEEGFPVDVFYFDFRKAFDSVPHFRLLSKIEKYGITGNTLQIILDFFNLIGTCKSVWVKQHLKENASTREFLKGRF
ncbi:MAG: reverse transcriptase family protein [Moritella sp.]|uniref:RNA-directed DNA polymerase n=1 Tax=Moritella sp. TaxID=78556 RepID=UPI001D6DF57E|nr:reverse transcriptase family protein [Moritella sp.]NQZ52424.1 reverse transcriptase family protein [Moritella sp.]